ncbi:copper resistance CopC family protein [Saccharomonospora sp. NB11]|jgi:methionine-rich copper-binding protein CopC|uniref:copper resistance CopC family protein n=1 Tax=Saccharomonospora sp. NB11 TaxID=1642298 RepID=UPI0018D17796|nr:copper resistance CopC family protein [Saccharomonospora sp. NB11]
MRRIATLVTASAVALFTVLATALPASAHNVLVSSNPAEGDELDTAPTEVVLTFDQPVQDADVNEIAVTGPLGDAWVDGAVEVDGTTVTAPLRPLGPEGEYVIGYRVLSADGHPVSDEIRFTLTQPGPGEASGTPDSVSPETGEAAPGQPQPGEQSKAQSPSDDARAANDDSTGVPVWVWLVGAGVLLVAGLVVALRMGRSQD